MEQKKILLVEDDAFLREVYFDTLKGEGYIVETASDGDEAVLKLKLGGWDLILLDILLPRLNGFQVLEKVKEDPAVKIDQASIIFLTQYDSDEFIKNALKLGGGYLIKSQITPGDIIQEVKMFMQKKNQSTPPNPAVA